MRARKLGRAGGVHPEPARRRYRVPRRKPREFSLGGPIAAREGAGDIAGHARAKTPVRVHNKPRAIALGRRPELTAAAVGSAEERRRIKRPRVRHAHARVDPRPGRGDGRAGGGEQILGAMTEMRPRKLRVAGLVRPEAAREVPLQRGRGEAGEARGLFDVGARAGRSCGALRSRCAGRSCGALRSCRALRACRALRSCGALRSCRALRPSRPRGACDTLRSSRSRRPLSPLRPGRSLRPDRSSRPCRPLHSYRPRGPHRPLRACRPRGPHRPRRPRRPLRAGLPGRSLRSLRPLRSRWSRRPCRTCLSRGPCRTLRPFGPGRPLLRARVVRGALARGRRDRHERNPQR